MGSIFDDQPTPPPSNTREPVKRGKNRDIERERLTASELNRGKRKLSESVELAFETLEKAMEFADYATAVKAATALLDRAGFSPRSNMESIPTSSRDLSEMSREDLADYAHKIAMLLKGRVAADKVAQISQDESKLPPVGQVH